MNTEQKNLMLMKGLVEAFLKGLDAIEKAGKVDKPDELEKDRNYLLDKLFEIQKKLNNLE